MLGENKKVAWSEDALSDVEEIARYLARRESNALARSAITEIKEAGERLSYQSLLWRERATVYPGARFLLVDPYVIVYDIRGERVNIVRVVHGVQDIQAIFHTEDMPQL